MKIQTLNPSGCHKREIKALDKLSKALPDDWFAYASLEMVGNDGGEIDLVICANDRLIAVEIKDWNYPIKDCLQTWETAGRSEKSPVISIREKSKFLVGRLRKHLAQKPYIPWVDSCVLLSGRATRASLSNESKEKTFELEFFLKLGNPSKFLEGFPQKGNRDTSLNELNNSTEITDLKSELSFFFNGKRNFRGATRRYNEFKADEACCFRHPQKIYEEFFAKKPGVKASNALLRVWDFDELANIDGAYREESNRKQLALREENTIGYLKEKNPALALEQAFLIPVSNEGRQSVTNRFFELYDLPASMKRLREASNQYRDKLKLRDRLSLATMLISRVAELHELGVAHRDLGDHCVWVEVPRRVAISGFATAHVPEEQTVSQIRTSVKANSSILPEDLMEMTSDHFQKDVFLLAVAVHQILFGEKPQLDDGIPLWKNRESTEAESLDSWFGSALDWEPTNRFKNAVTALEAFSESIEVEPQKVVSQKHFQEFQRERMIFPDPGRDAFLTKTQQLLHFKTPTEDGYRQIKLWTSARYQEGSEEQNLHLLQFLERCLAIQKYSFPGLQRVIDFGLTGMGCYVELEWVEGYTLNDVDLSAIDDETLSDIVGKLVESVWDIHMRDIYHGDIKPSNILLSKIKDAQYSVKFLDSLDFSPLGTERLSPAYSPPEGEDVAIPARDGFALRKTITQLLNRDYNEIEKDFIDHLGECCDPLYSPDVSNPDFEGVLTAISDLQTESPEIEPEELAAYSKFFTKNTILSGDDRGLPVSIDPDKLDKTKCSVTVCTPEFQLRVQVCRATGEAENCWLNDSSMGSFAAAMKHAHHRYFGVIHLIKADMMNLAELETLHADIDLEKIAVSQVAAPENGGVPSPLHFPEATKEDSSESVNVPVLWQAILDAEEEIIPTVEVVEESRSPSSFGEYQLTVSNASFDDDTHDWLDVGLEIEIRGAWKFIGKMDLTKSEVGKADLGRLVFINKRPNYSPPRKGSRIRLQDERAKKSFERRKKAAESVIQGKITSRSLIKIFSGDQESITTSSEFGAETIIPSSYGLNEPQKAALLNSLEQSPLSLIQGPPGTGKTRVIAAAVHFIVTQKPSSKILVVSQSHEAVNNATDQIVKLFAREQHEPSLVRVGRRSSLSDDLISYHSETIQTTYRNFFKERLAERVAPVGKELGLSAGFVEELTIVHARLAPLLDELKRMRNDSEESASEGSTLKSIQGRIAYVCGRHAGGPHFDDSSPEEAYAALELILVERYAISNMAAIETLVNVITLSLDWIKILESPVSGFDSFLVDTRQIVTGTCVGVGRWNLGIENKDFDWVIIDEAARCGPGELSVAMQVGHQTILVGDHKQLPPYVERGVVTRVSDTLGCSKDIVEQSDFHRVFTSPLGNTIARSLDTQYRMVEPIGRLVSDCFYPEIGGLSTGRSTSPDHYSLMPQALAKEVTWFDTGKVDDATETGYYTSFVNFNEIESIMDILQSVDDVSELVQLLSEEQSAKGVEAAIGIITAYKAQAVRIQEQLWASTLSQELKDLCKIDTVDSYQGKENPIIIFSPTRTNTIRKCGHTRSKERINVSLSRAQERLIVVGSREFWSQLPDTPLGQVHDYITQRCDSGESEFNYLDKTQ